MADKQKNDSSSEESDAWSSCSTDSNPDTMVEKMLNLRSPYFDPSLAINCKPSSSRHPSPSTSTARSPRGKPPPTGYYSIHQFRKAVPTFTTPPGRGRGRGRGRGQGRGVIPGVPMQHPVLRPESESKSTEETCVEGKVEEKKEEHFYPIPGRKFLPHQLPVFRPRKKQPNVITLMDDEEGPLSVLNRVRKERRKIKVWTRNITGIRGFCVGVLDAFDKHWNLVLRDVDEQWQRRRRVKFPLEFSGNSEQLVEEDLSYKSEEFLSSYSQKTSGAVAVKKKKERKGSILRGLRTMNLVEGPDALKSFRIGYDLKREPSEEDPTVETETPRKIPDKISTSKLRKKRVVLLDKPRIDFHGCKIVAQSKKYEVVQRHIHQLFLMGNEVVFIETEVELEPAVEDRVNVPSPSPS